MDRKYPNPQPCIEYLVKANGREFIWSHTCEESLRRELKEKSYKPTLIQPLSEYEAEIEAMERQEEYQHKLNEAIERRVPA